MSRTILILQRGSVFSLNLFNLVFMHIFYCLSEANHLSQGDWQLTKNISYSNHLWE